MAAQISKMIKSTTKISQASKMTNKIQNKRDKLSN